MGCTSGIVSSLDDCQGQAASSLIQHPLKWRYAIHHEVSATAFGTCLPVLADVIWSMFAEKKATYSRHPIDQTSTRSSIVH